jgi:hypothetical protein
MTGEINKLTARRLYKSFSVKGLVGSSCQIMLQRFRFLSVLLNVPRRFHIKDLFVSGATVAPIGPGLPRSRGFWITHNDAPQSVALLWKSDQLVTETST